MKPLDLSLDPKPALGTGRYSYRFLVREELNM